MSEFVGVDPAGLQELAGRLQRLHTLLARHGPMIQQKMQKWDSGVSFAALPRLIDEALNDARDMQARTTKAYDLAREKGWKGLGGDAFHHDRAHPPTVHLDWTTTGQSGTEATQDAQALAGAVTSKDPEQASAGLPALAENLSRHLGDKAYLAAFWAEACPQALQAARALTNRAGATLFSAESASILRALGSSLAAATQMRLGTGKERRPLLSEATRAAITRNPDPWSVGMLFKYGPDGKIWDSRFLAEVTRSMLDARAAGEIEIPIPGSTSADLLEAESRTFSGPKLRAEFDPVVAVIDRASQNGQAARHVLGDPPSGFRYATMLVSDQWHTQGSSTEPFTRFARVPVPARLNDQVDLSSHAADFLRAAVSAGRGATEDASESAWSVVNIVRAASAFSTRHPGEALPCDIRRALVFTAGRYLPDLAASAAARDAVNEARLDGAEGVWRAHLSRDDLSRFLRAAHGSSTEY
ncbi:hypothetical protein GCM10022226_10770 [Sphaerisporangium flaviroseum]|uniref:Uncharacterized protein n=1 Tax=Sphaerisporangium flaviroseum TaxID=509199 RepID=A0ABP7HFS4_9ACTN